MILSLLLGGGGIAGLALRFLAPKLFGSLLGKAKVNRFPLAAIIATGAAAVMGFFLVTAQVENRHLTKVNANLDGLIHDPATGYVAQLAQATTNVTQLNTSIESQKRQFDKKAADDAAALAETTRQLKLAQAESAVARKQAAQIMATKPQGNTLEDRVRDIDARILETLK